MVEAIYNRLKDNKQLDNTYLVFTSDNGWMQGEHRLAKGKNAPYEPSIHRPLGIRGPNIPAGRDTTQMALNIDLAPTFAELGGATMPGFVDGRSLVPTFSSDASSWRKRFLEEYFDKEDRVTAHSTVRTASEKYMEYKGDFKEFYDLASDPNEMDNLEITQPGVDNSALATKLKALRNCSGQSCRDVEDAP
jgi:N-acetylglucosamine-6-sulfatase